METPVTDRTHIAWAISWLVGAALVVAAIWLWATSGLSGDSGLGGLVLAIALLYNLGRGYLSRRAAAKRHRDS
jgi:1,4-dihydroxy-2-naphthoate octaprenyltransferase